MQALASVNLTPRGGAAKEIYLGASFVWQCEGLELLCCAAAW